MTKTEVKKLIERVSEARASGRPIVFVRTDELQVIYEFIKEQDIIAQSYKTSVNGKVVMPSVRYVLPDFVQKDEGIYPNVIEKPTLFVLLLDEQDKENEEYEALCGKLFRFVQLYTRSGLVRVENAETTYRQALEYIDKSLILIVTPLIPEIPASIALYSEYISLCSPKGKELYDYLLELVAAEDPSEPDVNDVQYRLFIDRLCGQFQGMSRTKIRQILLKFKEKYDRLYLNLDEEEDERLFDEKMRSLIREEKEQLIATSSILQLKNPKGKQAVGVNKLNAFVKDSSDLMLSLRQNEQRWQLKPPKGVLVTGVPGSGKSLMAQYAAYSMELPLIKMDMGDVQDKYVGSSEQRMTEALELVNAMSPCVLWVDEIEKSFAGVSGNGGSDVPVRLFGKFLAWMQEKEDEGVCCFVFATANRIDQLPPELFRSGRFDAKFCTFMPTAAECGEIFNGQIAKLCEDYAQSPYGQKYRRGLFDTNRVNGEMFVREFLNDERLCLLDVLRQNDTRVTRKNKFFTGADIENLIKSAQKHYVLHHSSIHGQNTEYDSETFILCMKQVLPDMRTYGETNLDDVAIGFAVMAHNNFLPASDASLMPFDAGQYDEHRDGALYQEDNEEKHLRGKCSYDCCLYLTVRNVLNTERSKIMEKIDMMMRNK